MAAWRPQSGKSRVIDSALGSRSTLNWAGVNGFLPPKKRPRVSPRWHRSKCQLFAIILSPIRSRRSPRDSYVTKYTSERGGGSFKHRSALEIYTDWTTFVTSDYGVISSADRHWSTRSIFFLDTLLKRKLCPATNNVYKMLVVLGTWRQ